MVGFAKREEIPQLRALWCLCFGDEPAVADYYFQTRFVPEETVVYREAGRVLSMSTMMEVSLKGEKGYYVYAVATDPAARGRGLMRRVDAFLQEEARRRGGVFTCLIPASPSLFTLYAAMGYETAFGYRETVIRGPAADLDFAPCPEERFLTLRRDYLDGMPESIRHPQADERHLYREWLHYGGAVLECSLGYAVTIRRGDTLLLRECSGPGERMAKSLLAHAGLEKALWLAPPAGQAPDRAFGMGRMLNNGSFCQRFGDGCYMPMMQE